MRATLKTDMAIGVIILAAGGSSRMGTPKQLLPYCGQSLIRHSARAALGSVCDRVVVVIGSRAEEMMNELADLPLEVIEKPQLADWHEFVNPRRPADVAVHRRSKCCGDHVVRSTFCDR